MAAPASGANSNYFVVAYFVSVTKSALVPMLLSAPEEKQIDIYPVPAADKITIKASSGMKSISLINMQGQVMLVKDLKGLDEVDIDLSGMQPGEYLLMVNNGDVPLIRRIIKQ